MLSLRAIGCAAEEVLTEEERRLKSEVEVDEGYCLELYEQRLKFPLLVRDDEVFLRDFVILNAEFLVEALNFMEIDIDVLLKCTSVFMVGMVGNALRGYSPIAYKEGKNYVHIGYLPKDTPEDLVKIINVFLKLYWEGEPRVREAVLQVGI